MDETLRIGALDDAVSEVLIQSPGAGRSSGHTSLTTRPAVRRKVMASGRHGAEGNSSDPSSRGIVGRDAGYLVKAINE